MIVKEFLRTREDGVNLYITYSDEHKYIQQVETGNKYDAAIDIENAPFTYIELDEVIEVVDESSELEEVEVPQENIEEL